MTMVARRLVVLQSRLGVVAALWWSLSLVMLFRPILPVVQAQGQGYLNNEKYRRAGGTRIRASYLIELTTAYNTTQAIVNLIEDMTGYLQAKYTTDFEKFDAKVKADRIYEYVNGLNLRIENVPDGFLGMIVSEILNFTDILSVEEDQEIRSQQTAGVCPASWGLDRIDQINLPLDYVYHTDYHGSDIDIYILDTGVRATHEQFDNGRATCPRSFIPGQTCTDGYGHGTHVAGTAAGKDYGIANQAKIIGVKVLGNNGSGSTSSLMSGINWVTGQLRSNGGRRSVISMSLGAMGNSFGLNQAIKNAAAAGAVSIVAAGNDDANACSYTPASSPDAITVASIDIDDRRSSFSNFGSCVDIFAPGRDILSAWYTSDTASEILSGTSMAAPHVSGLAAIYWEQNPTFSVNSLIETLLSSATEGAVNDAESLNNRLACSVQSTTSPGPQSVEGCVYSFGSGAAAPAHVSSWTRTTITCVVMAIITIALTVLG